MRAGSLFGLLLILTGIILTGICAAQDTSFPVGPQYLVTSDSPQFLRPIATPSLSLSAPLPDLPSLPAIGPAVEDQPYVVNATAQQGPDLFPIYYGYPMPSVVEASSEEPSRTMLADTVEVGVSGMTDAQSLREFGYGLTMAEAASRSKARHASRVYTNADLERLRRD